MEKQVGRDFLNIATLVCLCRIITSQLFLILLIHSKRALYCRNETICVGND